MRGLLVLTTLMTSACAHRQPPATCGPGWVALSEIRSPGNTLVEPGGDATIRSIAVTGVGPALAATLRAVVQTTPGQRVADAPLAADLRRLWALGVIADARVELAGDALMFVVAPRPLIGRIVLPHADPVALRRFALLSGARFDPSRIHRIASATTLNYVRDGYLDAQVAVAVTPRADAVDVCVAATPGPRVTIAKLELAGRRQVPEAVLRAAMHGAKGGVNVVGGIYDEEALNADKPWLLDAYYERGLLLAEIRAPEVRRDGKRLSVMLPIVEGPVFRFGSIDVEDLPEVRLPIASGEVASRTRIAQVRDALTAIAGVSIDVRTKIDHAGHRIDITFAAERRWPWDVFLSWPLLSP